MEYEPKYDLLKRQLEAYRIQNNQLKKAWNDKLSTDTELDKQQTMITLTITEAFCEEKQRENPHLTLEQCAKRSVFVMT